MPPKHTQRKRFEPLSLRIKDELLDEWLNTLVKVFTVTGGCLTGRLVRYDDESLLISPKTIIERDKIVSMYQARNGPAKAPTGPDVRGRGDDGSGPDEA